MVDHDDPLAEGGNVVKVVGGENDGGAFLPVDIGDSLADIVLDNHVQTYCRFVEKQHLRVVKERSRNIGSHALTERQGSDRRFDEGLKLQHFVEKSHLLFVSRVVDLVDFLQHGVGFSQRKIPPELRPLSEHHADFLDIAFAVFARILSVDNAGSFCGREDAGEHFDDGRFACAVGTDKAENFPFVHMEGYVVDSLYNFSLGTEKRLHAPLKPRLLDCFFEVFFEVLYVYHCFGVPSLFSVIFLLYHLSRSNASHNINLYDFLRKSHKKRTASRADASVACGFLR